MDEIEDNGHLNERDYLDTIGNGLSAGTDAAGAPSYADISERVPRREIRVLKISKVLQEKPSDS